MKFAQRLLLLASALFFYQFPVGTCRTAAATAENELASTADSTVPSQSVRTKNTMLIRASSGEVSAGTSVAKTITISMPAETRTETIQVVLNGKDVTSKFHETTCSEGVCESGTLSSADGLRSQKNVLYAIGRKSDGTLASSRLRFDGQSPVAAVAPHSQALAAGLRKAQISGTVSNSAADTSFLPSIIFKTLTPGGWNGSSPWIQIGTEQLPDAGFSCPCPGMGYLVVVVDRQTLQEIPGGTQCEGGSYQLATYLQSLPNTQIAIVGADWEYDAAGDLDASAIGGTNYTPLNGATSYPLGYMAIGAGGAAPGSAYENFYTKAMDVVFDPFATGVLVEDAYGNYNFQSSLAVEYLVTPNDQANNNQSTVTLAGSIHNAGQSGKNYQTFSFIDQQVANQMFSSGALNIPFDEFVTEAGPMASVFKNGATDNFIVFPVSDQTSVGSGRTSGASATTTTLTAPATSVLGEDVALQASVATASGPVPSGNGLGTGYQLTHNFDRRCSLGRDITNQRRGRYFVRSSLSASPLAGPKRRSEAAHALLRTTSVVNLAWMPDGLQQRLENLAANHRLADDPGDCNEWNDDQKHPANPEPAVTRVECGDCSPHSVLHFATQVERKSHVENQQI